MKVKTVIETIREHYDHIFSAERKVADFILENPEKAVNANVSEAANYSGVSDATVIRLCKHIGYQGYYQLKINLSRDLGRDQVTGADLEHIEGDAVDSVFHAMAVNLMAVGKNLDQGKLLECANLIKGCGTVHIVAVGNTSPIAQYMGFRLGRLGVKCTYNMVPEYFLNHVNLADVNDVVLAITRSGTSRQVVQALELAREKELRTIVISGHEFSPASRLADSLLLCRAAGQPADYREYSHLSEMAVIDVLLHFVTNEEMIAANDAEKPEMILAEYKL